MRNKKCVLLAIIVMMCNIAVGFGQTKKVAILNIVDKEDAIKYGVKLLLMGQLSAAITNTPGYEAYDRVDIASIVSEQEFQRMGFVNSEQVRRLGEMTGADYILVAEVAKLDDSNLIITAKILNVETARLDNSADVQTTTSVGSIEDGCRRLAFRLLPRDVAFYEVSRVSDKPFIDNNSRKPQFQGGGMAKFTIWVNQNLEYPQIAIENNIQGRVMVRFTIEKDGSLTNIQVLSSPNSSLSEAVVRVLQRSPKWEPGFHRGRPVRMDLNIPVDFSLE